MHPTKTQISLHICTVWSESSLSAWNVFFILDYPKCVQWRVWSDWMCRLICIFSGCTSEGTFSNTAAQGPVVQSSISLTSSLRVISLTVLADSIHNILIFFAEKMWVATHIFSTKKFQHICISLNVNFNKSLTNDVVSFEQLGPVVQSIVSLTSLLMVKMLTVLVSTKSNSQLFLLKKCE